jgi:hypothetical protein
VIFEVLGTLAVVGVLVVLGVIADRKLGLVPRPAQLKEAGERKPAAPAFAAGEAPATALSPNAAALARLRAVPPRCAADGVAMAAEPDDSVRYNERELLVLRFRCATCGVGRSIYCQTDRLQPSHEDLLRR